MIFKSHMPKRRLCVMMLWHVSIRRLLQLQGVLRCLIYGQEDKNGNLIGTDRRLVLWLFSK